MPTDGRSAYRRGPVGGVAEGPAKEPAAVTEGEVHFRGGAGNM